MKFQSNKEPNKTRVSVDKKNWLLVESKTGIQSNEKPVFNSMKNKVSIT